jgi:hypothetical protein
VINLIETIESTGRALGITVSIKSVSVDADRAHPELPKTAKLSIAASGQWTGVSKLLESLESLPYPIMIDKTSLVKGEGIWNFSADISTFAFN